MRSWTKDGTELSNGAITSLGHPNGGGLWKAPRWWAGLWGRKAERLLAPLLRAKWPVWRLTCPTLCISQGHHEAQGKGGGQFNRKASDRAVADAVGSGVERPGSLWGHCTAKSPPQPPGRSQWEQHHVSGRLEGASVHRQVHARCRHEVQVPQPCHMASFLSGHRAGIDRELGNI